jgi:hypothetical protein
MGTPPASKSVVENLPEIVISEEHCKKDESTGKVELPRCAICCEDLTTKAT